MDKFLTIKELIEILIKHPPSTATPDAYEMLLNGPGMKKSENVAVVSNQDQVDNLLESMGF